MRLTLVGLLLFASTALGQTVTFSATGDIIQNDQIVVSQANCGLDRTVNWTRVAGNCDVLHLWLSNESSCTGAPGAGDLSLEEIAVTDTRLTGTVTFNASEALAADGATCDSQTATKTFRLCATTKRLGNLGGCDESFVSIGTPSISFIYDPEPPAVPEAPSVTGLDAALSVSVKVPSDAVFMEVQVLQLVPGGDGGVGAGEVITTKRQVSSNTVFRMADGIENGIEYAVQAIAIDRAGNQSEPSPTATGTPVASSGFYQGYLDAGGAETGGCAAAGGGITGCAVLASLGIWLSSRRKRS
ncbi:MULTISPECIES: MXAN_2561 family MXYO-CTERM-anchored protein [Myxococcus]|uniref:Fibronectin type-III domain-containing protein n=1 Tax=Myxococcus xanthus TaxID=34 RepID=A0AAE6FYI6_MYXXA|nr:MULTISPECIES: MXAN_2561 family MXYO-CTERM-anchored protein [Myxococcus]QDE67700.1 hypothetical protein BHS09_12295 [Myxococcus xanthus]QDE74978.1 hypothetical protein BHS08_12310 [Myxococcus xanthus]QDE82249.1 hypothetical protein BHS07_12205 [Myxococcus xanthus]QDF04041.1 hypothetical protein BHS04_12605 [Myxococcus xanthus]WAM28999.1 hypothetical protein OZ403_13095 [Myxococcus sp. NMCA1]